MWRGSFTHVVVAQAAWAYFLRGLFSPPVTAKSLPCKHKPNPVAASRHLLFGKMCKRTTLTNATITTC